MDTTALRKILELERKHGYRNDAVMGGMDRYLQRCGNLIPRHLLPSTYGSLGTKEREEWARGVLKQLDGSPGGDTKQGRMKKAVKVEYSLDAPVTAVKGVSTQLAAKFRRLGVETVRDLLYFFPRRHIDYSRTKTISRLEIGAEQTIIATVWEAKQAMLGGRRSAEAIIGDETGNMRVVWFNQPYLAAKFRTNSQWVFSGKVSLFKGMKVLQSPEYEPLTEDLIHTGRLVPVYPLTGGLGARSVRRIVKETVDRSAPELHDFLPDDVKNRIRLPGLSEAILQAHYPEDGQLWDAARQRLAFDELFLMQLGLLSRRREWKQSAGTNAVKPDRAIVGSFLELLPFKLTGGQQRTLSEILSDMSQGTPMSRLLQGEVGSGKTVVATAALLSVVAGGYQGAFMAPTEILAEQHFSSISGLLAGAGGESAGDGYICSCSCLVPRGITLALLIGSMSRSDKDEVHRAVAAGEVDIVVGTHALIQEGVSFDRLGLAIADEQHRFGVMQRLALRQKGMNPHLLVMTATPIPRSLALTLYGDLDLSVIDEMPHGRSQVKTMWLEPEDREKAYRFLRKEIGAGHQAFIICPLIEDSEAIDTRAAVSEYERLSRGVFPDLRLGLLHGKLRAADKEEVMRKFRNRQLDMLVATSVVEVGIDVPNATVMLVEGADRFGLAQLHQFRGRVGRGAEQGYCILVADNPSPEGRERLKLLKDCHDGFKLAEEDLNLRGPGEFFGARQSGMPDLKMARMTDIGLLEMARREALRLFEKDAELSRPEHRLLAGEVGRLWRSDITGMEA